MSLSPPTINHRLASIDILRGLDLFLLLFLQPVLWKIGEAAHIGQIDSLLWHFDHETWEGFRLWDLVMPLFLFMVGASMPFSLSKYCNGAPLSTAYRKVIRRVVMLFIFGMIVQGNLLAFDPNAIYIYTNTLQAIACGYLIAAVFLLHLSIRWQVAATVMLLFLYWLPFQFYGDYTPEGNFAYRIDEIVIGRFRGDLSYTWIWSSLTFGATVMLGTFAGRMMRNSTRPEHTAARLLGLGLALLSLGILWSFQMPVIKRIWTSSMTLYSGGWCFILMAIFYWSIDVKGWHRGVNRLKIYGMNPITAYMIGEVINFRSVVHSVTWGLQAYMGNEWYAALLTFGNALILYFILLWMSRQKIYLKI